MERNQKFSKEVKIEACKKYHNGGGSFEGIAKEIGCNTETLRRWYYQYIQHGDSTFDSTSKNKSYDKEFKLFIIEECLSGKYSTVEISAKHNLAYSMVERWIKKYNNGIEIKSYEPRGDVYTMKARKTTYEERLEIAKWVILNDMNYKEAADKYGVNYALVYKWTKSYLKDGEESLQYKRRGPKAKNSLNECDLSEVEQLKLALEKEIALRKRRELEIEILKKKEEFEKKLRYRK